MMKQTIASLLESKRKEKLDSVTGINEVTSFCHKPREA